MFRQKNLKVKFQYFVVLVGILLLGVKSTAYLLTHSNGILSDALEGLVNVGAGLFTLYSLILSAKPKDEEHPYGHGKIEYISASIEGLLIGIAGLYTIGKASYNFFYPQQLSNLDLGLLLATIAGLLNFLLGHFSIRLGNKYNSIALISSGKHLKSDAYTSAGLLLGLFLVWFTNLTWLDNVIAILFGCLLSYTSIKIIRKSISGIMDEADFELVEKVITILSENRTPEWIDVHNLKIQRFGADYHLDAHVTLPYFFSLKQAHNEIQKIEKIIKEEFPSIELSILMDPCSEKSCRICQIKNCKVRQHKFQSKINWTLNNITKNKAHQ